MADNIAGVIQGTTRFVTAIKQSEQVPEKYILVTFSDPVSLETSKQTSNPDVMTEWLKNLTVNGGDDCPEYSLSGLITGGMLSNNDSTVYIYTDAPPKDYARENDAINILQSKNLTAKFRLRNECGSKRRRRRDSANARLPLRSKRQSNVYDRIAAATGGDVQRFATASELADKVEEDLMNDLSIIQNSTQTVNQNELPSSMAMIKWSIVNPNTENVTIEVDETVEALHLEINGTFSSSNILLRNPNGALMTHGSDNITVKDTGILTTISIQSPVTGMWTLENVGNDPVKLNITATSSFDVSSVLSEMSTNGIFYPVKDNPIYGKEYGIVVSVENLPANASISSILLVAEKGTSVTSLNASLLSVEPRLEYFAKTAITTQISGIQLHGIDSSGFPFIRSSRHIINPVDVALKMKPYIGDLPLLRREDLHYNITNFGTKTRL
uniref:Hemicentin-1-like n=1 Tax=Crassostrea virginica TaxID=6565 RepID=A0A8B8DPF3_CRAVI|nr:hemicentin-1-like [Crassostrea virginica]